MLHEHISICQRWSSANSKTAYCPEKDSPKSTKYRQDRIWGFFHEDPSCEIGPVKLLPTINFSEECRHASKNIAFVCHIKKMSIAYNSFFYGDHEKIPLNP